MHNSDVNLENPRSAKPFRPSGQPAGVHLTGTDAGRREALKVLGMEIAQTALQSIGMSTKDPWGPPIRLPEYALAVSLIFTKATSQTIILNTPPEQVRGTSILWSSLAHDKRFEQIPMSEAAPGDIIIGPGWQQGADGYAGIIVNHGRIVSNSSQGVQDNSSLSEIQRSHRAMVAFRYVGFWNYYRGKSLANAGFNADEPRLPAGQPGGGQWTSGGAEGMQMAPSTTSLSGGNNWTPGQSKPNSEVGKGQSTDSPRAGGPLTDAQRKLLEQKNAEAVAIIARLGDKGESPDTPESILNGPLNSAWGSNLGWMPGTTKWDLRQQYKGYSDQDIALMEAARRNGVRAAVLLAQAGLLPKSQVTALQLRGMGVLADATLNLGLVLAPYDSIATLGSRALVGTAEGTVGAESAELASRSGEISDKPISTASSPDYDAVK